MLKGILLPGFGFDLNTAKQVMNAQTVQNIKDYMHSNPDGPQDGEFSQVGTTIMVTVKRKYKNLCLWTLRQE